jgi:polyketide cyclase/dehydrase/lipid transport protein
MIFRPVVSSHSLILSHPIHVVRAFIADFRHATMWDPATLRSDPIGNSEAGPGSEWTTRSILAGRSGTGHYRLEWNNPYVVVLTGRHPGLTRTVEFTLADLGDHTEVNLTMRYHMRGLFRLSRRRRQRHALDELTGRAASGLPAALRARLRDVGLDDPAGAYATPDRLALPSQLVDPWYQAWRLTCVDHSAASSMYSATAAAPQTYHDLAATRSPLRPVVAPSAAEVHQIDQLLTEAGNRAAATIAAAVHAVHARLCDAFAHLGADASQLARQCLTAASEGTPPAAALLTLLTVREPAPPKIHLAARDELTEMIIHWTGRPCHYTDPAAALLTVVPAHLLPKPMRPENQALVGTRPT